MIYFNPRYGIDNFGSFGHLGVKTFHSRRSITRRELVLQISSRFKVKTHWTLLLGHPRSACGVVPLWRPLQPTPLWFFTSVLRMVGLEWSTWCRLCTTKSLWSCRWVNHRNGESVSEMILGDLIVCPFKFFLFFSFSSFLDILNLNALPCCLRGVSFLWLKIYSFTMHVSSKHEILLGFISIIDVFVRYIVDAIFMVQR